MEQDRYVQELLIRHLMLLQVRTPLGKQRRLLLMVDEEVGLAADEVLGSVNDVVARSPASLDLVRRLVEVKV